MSDRLRELDIHPLGGWNPRNLHDLPRRPDLVVVGNVCRPDNPEAAAARDLDIPCVSFPEALRLLFLQHHPRRLVITGTHGKTTTSALLSWLLTDADADPSFMIGGVAANFHASHRLGRGPAFVIEGDEYDSAFFDKVPKFYHYDPTHLLINNIEFDHADIYPDLDAILHVFTTLCRRLPPDATLLANLDDPNVQQVTAAAPCPVLGVGLGPRCAWRARNVQLLPGGGAAFDLSHHDQHITHLRSPLPGLHNVRNATAAAALALDQGLSPDQVADALTRFRSVRKRQELVGHAAGVTLYDDFAHHPSAVRETVAAIRARHPDATLWGLFEAKSNTSRRAIFQHDYPDALSACDHVVLSSPWRRDPGLPPDQLLDLPRVAHDLRTLHHVDAHLIPDVDDIVSHVSSHAHPGHIILAMSGANFGGLHAKLLSALQQMAA